MTETLRPGLFLSFEGMDGSGKTTQMRLLIERLGSEGYDVLETAEPGGTPIGRQIRRILLDSANKELSSRAELLLYFACRAQNVDEWIRPALAAGRVVVSDRYTDSTVAYQGAGRGLPMDVIGELHQFACGPTAPDLTIYLDIDRATGLARARPTKPASTTKPPSSTTGCTTPTPPWLLMSRAGYAESTPPSPSRGCMPISGPPSKPTSRPTR